MKLLKTHYLMPATRCSLSFLSENKYLLLTFLFITAINFLFFFTYPINVAAWDYPNYLAMMHGRVSNLMHASGYPAFLMVLLSIFDVPRGKTIFDIVWLDKIQLLQFLLHAGLMLFCIIICARVFNKLSAFIMCLVWGLSVLFMAGMNSAAPEWLQGELIVLSLMLSTQAFICTSNKTKIISYVFSWVIFSFAYLVKYNSLIIFPILALIIAFDKKSVCWKIFAISMAMLPCLILILAFVEFFHYPTTKSRQLNYDHAWVLLKAIPEVYFSLPPEQLKINSLRWKALSSIVPADYSMAGAYCCIDAGAPPNVRDAYYIKYRQIMRLSKNELIDFLKLNPLPSGYIQQDSAVPLYWYVGLPETDTLGIATFKESLLAIPSVYLKRIFTGLKTWSAFDKQTVPFYSNQLRLNFGGSINDKSGFIKVIPPVHTPPVTLSYWNPKEVVWSPGVRVFEYLASAIMPRWLELLIFAGATLGVLFSTNSRIRFFGLLYLGSILIFSTASFVLVGMRHKEFVSIIPLMAVFYGVGLSSVYCIFRDALASKIGGHHVK